VKWTFCNEKCESRFKLALAEQLVSPEELNQRVHRIFEAECPSCHRFARNSLVGTTTVTGLLVAFRVKNRKHICCARCARMKLLGAAAHCLAFGWWSPKALIANVLILPANLLGLLFIREPKGPTVALVKFVKTRVAEELAPQLHAAALAVRRAVEEEESRDDEAERI
jgi:hypothetical protein